VSDHGQDVDDRPLASLGHAWSEGGDENERSLDIDGVDGVDVLVADLGRWAEGEHTSVIDQYVDPSAAEMDGFAGQGPDRLCIAELGGHEIGFPACSTDLMDDGITSGGVPAANQDVCATIGEQHGRSSSDAAGRPGHQGGRSYKIGRGHSRFLCFRQRAGDREIPGLVVAPTDVSFDSAELDCMTHCDGS
jgi:hypothetical protein